MPGPQEEETWGPFSCRALGSLLPCGRLWMWGGCAGPAPSPPTSGLEPVLLSWPLPAPQGLHVGTWPERLGTGQLPGCCDMAGSLSGLTWVCQHSTTLYPQRRHLPRLQLIQLWWPWGCCGKMVLGVKPC